MSTPRTTEVVLLLFLAPFAACASGSEIPKRWHEFVSVQGGYTAHFPKSWYVLEPHLPTLYISNFRPSRAVRGVVVPENGATISVVPPPKGISSVQQWINLAVTRVRSKNLITVQRFDTNPPLRVTEVVFESIEGPETVSWYFELAGRLLVANLSYWNGDANEQKYRQVLREMIEVIAPIVR